MSYPMDVSRVVTFSDGDTYTVVTYASPRRHPAATAPVARYRATVVSAMNRARCEALVSVWLPPSGWVEVARLDPANFSPDEGTVIARHRDRATGWVVPDGAQIAACADALFDLAMDIL